MELASRKVLKWGVDENFMGKPKRNRQNDLKKGRLVTRRNFLIASAGALGATAIGRFLFRNREETYAQWFKNNIANTDSLSFVHPKFLTDLDYNPSESEKQILLEKLSRQSGGNVTILDSKFYSGHSFDCLDVRPEVLQKYLEGTREELRRFFDNIGEDKGLLAKLDFNLLGKNTLVKPVSESLVPVYLTKEIDDNEFIAKYLVSAVGMQQEFLVFRGKTKGGEANGQLNVEWDKKGLTIKGMDNQPILISTTDNPLASRSLPLAEVLHYSLRNVKSRVFQSEANKLLEDAKNVDVLNHANLQRRIDELIKVEEGVVHALEFEYMQSRAKELGFTGEDLRGYQKGYKGAVYSLVPGYRSLIKSRGAKELLNLFKQGSKEIFREN